MNKNANKFHLSVASNSPDLGPFVYNVCGVMQQRVYRTLFRNVELKKRLVEVWSMNIIDTAVNEWRKILHACVHTKPKGLIFQIFSVSSWTIG